MYSYNPIQNKKPVYVIIVMLFLIGTVFLIAAALSSQILKYIDIAAAVLCLSIILQLSIRFINTSYKYCVDLTEEGYIFYVNEKTTKSERVVCRIMLHDIKDIKCIERGNKKDKRKNLPKVRVNNYCASLFEIKSCILYIEERGELVGIHFSPDEKMMSIIREATQLY